MGKAKRYKSFSASIAKDPTLKGLRRKYAKVSAKNRKMAAQYEYDSEVASDLFGVVRVMLGDAASPKPKWPFGFLSLAIDPLHAPALLTVGALEHRHGYVKEAMKLFLTLTTLPEDEEDLAVIIDKAADFLIDEEDFENALTLYTAAEKAYPNQGVFPAGLGYVLYKLGNLAEALNKARRAVELEPENHLWLNDLGYTLVEAGHLEEAEKVLKKSISLAPDDCDLARHNLEFLYSKKSNPGCANPY